jgi:hypothetical protein
VLDLTTGDARQVLVGDRSTFANPKQHLMIGKEVALRPDGSVTEIQADGIALSPDARWLYYRPLTVHNYWRVPTSALRDARLSDLELAKKVEYLGNSVLSGGLTMDGNGTLYGGDLEHRTVVSLTMTPGNKLRKSLRQRAVKAILGGRFCDQRWLPLHCRFSSLGSRIQEQSAALRSLYNLRGETSALGLRDGAIAIAK